MDAHTTAYSIYNVQTKNLTKVNPLASTFPPLPGRKYDIIYADPPWDYGGKTQFDRSMMRKYNDGFDKRIFLSSASFKYPTLTTEQLKELNVKDIANDDCILFMWTTGPHLANSVELGRSWGFEYKTVAFVWDKMVHNPGRYTLSQTEFVLLFKRGKIPSPRGARNVKQMVSVHRTKHSEKPEEVISGITRMFPSQSKIELFARRGYDGWDNWGLEIPESNLKILSQEEIDKKKETPTNESYD